MSPVIVYGMPSIILLIFFVGGILFALKRKRAATFFLILGILAILGAIVILMLINVSG